MPTKGQKMSNKNKEVIRNSMLKFWANMSPEEKAERIEKFVGSRRKPELADLPPQLEQPREYFCGYQKKFRATHPGYYAWLRQKKFGKTNLNYDEWYYSYWLQKKGRK